MNEEGWIRLSKRATVFLAYARQDRKIAERIRRARRKGLIRRTALPAVARSRRSKVILIVVVLLIARYHTLHLVNPAA